MLTPLSTLSMQVLLLIPALQQCQSIVGRTIVSAAASRDEKWCPLAGPGHSRQPHKYRWSPAGQILLSPFLQAMVNRELP